MLPPLPPRVWLTALAILASALAAQEETPEKAREEAQAGAEPRRARTMVLHLADGTVLRAPARETEQGWEVQRDGQVVVLSATEVLRARSEHELRAQAATLERSLRRDEPVRRVAYAEWLASEGLHAEALRQLDRVLEREPDQPDAVALLARARIPLALPPVPRSAGELEELFARAARLSPAGREVALQRLRPPEGLESEQEIPGLRAALARELTASVPGRRAFATLALRRLFPGSEAEALLGRAVLDSSAEVRTSAALALKAFEDPAVIVPVVRAIGSRYPEVRTNAIEALAAMEYREAVEPLYTHLVALQTGGGRAAPRVHIFTGRQRAYVQDYDVEVAQAAAVADPIINTLVEGQVLDVAVVGVTEYVVASERAAVRRALARLTGADPGETTAAWQRWWQEHGDAWTAGKPPSKTPTSPSGRG